VYSPSSMGAGMGLASGKPPSRLGSGPRAGAGRTGSAGTEDGSGGSADDDDGDDAERSPAPARRGGAGREVATVPAEDDLLTEIASLANTFPECAHNRRCLAGFLSVWIL